MSFTDEDRIKGGQNRATHGVHAIESRGEAAMTAEQRQTLTEIKSSLETPEGILTASRDRVAMGVMIMGVLEAYVKAELEAGKSLDAIAIFKAWPAFQNSTVRALKQLDDLLPDNRDRADHALLVEQMSERVDKASSAGEQEQAE